MDKLPVVPSYVEDYIDVKMNKPESHVFTWRSFWNIMLNKNTKMASFSRLFYFYKALKYEILYIHFSYTFIIVFYILLSFVKEQDVSGNNNYQVQERGIWLGWGG